jgi:translation initiation factor IF-2/pilus assembly protein FimV
MKKILLTAAALSLGSVALAQSTTNQDTTGSTTQTEATTPTDQPSGQTVDDPSQATGPEGITQQGTDPEGQATAPAGMNQGAQGQTMPAQQAAMSASPATAEYPPCSRTVTDSCVQTYERGVRRSRRGR